MNVVPLRRDGGNLAALVDEWLAEYSNGNTRERYAGSVRLVAAHARALAPNDFTPAAVAAWAADYTGANNTVPHDARRLARSVSAVRIHRMSSGPV